MGSGIKFALGAALIALCGMAVLQLTGYADRGTWIKMTVSTGFIMSAFLAGGHTTRYGNAILVALFFSWWGDLFLDLKGTFLFGLVAFLLGHVFFAVAFLVHGVNWKWVLRVAPLLAVLVGGVLVWLGDSPGDLKIPVYAYIAVITTMVALSFGAKGQGASWWLVVGAVMFYVSDICVAREKFVAKDDLNRLIGLPLYFGAQYVFAYTCRLVR